MKNKLADCSSYEPTCQNSNLWGHSLHSHQAYCVYMSDIWNNYYSSPRPKTCLSLHWVICHEVNSSGDVKRFQISSSKFYMQKRMKKGRHGLLVDESVVNFTFAFKMKEKSSKYFFFCSIEFDVCLNCFLNIFYWMILLKTCSCNNRIFGNVLEIYCTSSILKTAFLIIKEVFFF